MFTAQEIVRASLKDARLMIQANLRDDDRWLLRGLLAVYNFQTDDEQNSHSTRYHNSVGFSGPDAEILTSFAQQVQRWQRDRQNGTARYNRPLSDKQLRIVRARMTKYAGQLARIARVNHAAQAVQSS
jgi:hypothetical protein